MEDVPERNNLDVAEKPEIYLGFVEEPDITPLPMEAFGSVFDEDDFDDDLL